MKFLLIILGSLSLFLINNMSMMFYSLNLCVFIFISSMFMSIMSYNWVACIILIMYLGGLMILFLYMSSMGMKSSPINFKHLFKMLLSMSFSISLLWLIKPTNLLKSQEFTTFTPEIFYFLSNNNILIILTIYLLITMILSLLMTLTQSSPLKL